MKRLYNKMPGKQVVEKVRRFGGIKLKALILIWNLDLIFADFNFRNQRFQELQSIATSLWKRLSEDPEQ